MVSEEEPKDIKELIRDIIYNPLEQDIIPIHGNNNLDDDNYKLLIFEQAYRLLSIKQKKKKKKFNTNNIKLVLHFLLKELNVWYTTNIIDILLNRNTCRDIQSFYFLEAINYLATNNNYQTGFHLIKLIKEVSSLVHSIKKSIKMEAKNTLSLLLNCSGNNDL